MDTFIISKISDYYSTSRNYLLAKELKNKTVSKVLLEKCHKTTGYVCYVDGKTLKTVSVPMKKEKSDYPELNYEEMTSKGIKNNMFFYNLKGNVIHCFQFLPYKYVQLNIDEAIEETVFYEVDERCFWLVVNHTHIYKFERLKRTSKITLGSGFFFEEVLLDNKLHSDFFGEEMIVQDLDDEEVYRLKFLNNTYYDIIAKDLVVIDFSFNEKVLEGVLPSNNLTLEEKKNCLFRFHLVKGSPNKIELEFVSFLPKELKIQRFCAKNGFFWSRNDEINTIYLYKRDKELAKIEIPDMDQTISVGELDKERILIEYDSDIAILEVESAKLSNKIDMKSRIDNLKYLGTIEKVGDYYHVIVLLDQEEIGAWRQYVLDQNFSPVYEIIDDKYYFYSD
jgi:hypothetical protein